MIYALPYVCFTFALRLILRTASILGSVISLNGVSRESLPEVEDGGTIKIVAESSYDRGTKEMSEQTTTDRGDGGHIPNPLSFMDLRKSGWVMASAAKLGAVYNWITKTLTISATVITQETCWKAAFALYPQQDGSFEFAVLARRTTTGICGEAETTREITAVVLTTKAPETVSIVTSGGVKSIPVVELKGSGQNYEQRIPQLVAKTGIVLKRESDYLPRESDYFPDECSCAIDATYALLSATASGNNEVTCLKVESRLEDLIIFLDEVAGTRRLVTVGGVPHLFLDGQGMPCNEGIDAQSAGFTEK